MRIREGARFVFLIELRESQVAESRKAGHAPGSIPLEILGLQVRSTRCAAA